MLKSGETGETPFNHVISVDVTCFVHQWALCSIPVDNRCLKRYKYSANLRRVKTNK